MEERPDRRFHHWSIGCGHWGPNHIRVFRSLSGVSVRWAAESDESRRNYVETLFPSTRTTPDFSRILEDDTVDAVVVATPAACHHEHALQALSARKHVLCEKPLALTVDDCDELIETAAKNRRILMTGHVFLSNPGILHLKRLLHQQELGRIYYASAVRANPGPIRADAGVSFDLACHDISIFNFLFDTIPLRVSAEGRDLFRPGIEDAAFIRLTYPGDVLVHIATSWLSPKKIREITLVGDRKMAVWNDLENASVTLYRQREAEEPFYADYGEFQILSRGEEAIRAPVDPEEPLKKQARLFIQAIEDGSAGPCSGEKGREVLVVLEAIERSIRSDGFPVEIADRWASRASDRRARSRRP